MDLNPALQTFVAESRELLEQMEQSLLALEHDCNNRELLDAVFRAAHTIKGSAGLFGFDGIVAFTHQVETLLDRLRSGELALDAALSALLLRCGDHIGALIAPATAARPPAAEVEAAGEALLAELARHTAGAAVPAAAPAAPACAAAADFTRWRITLGFGPEVLRNGMDPLSFLRYLGTLGELLRVTTGTARMPALAEMDPEACYLDFEIELASAAERATIEAAFDFVREDCAIAIEAIETIEAAPRADPPATDARPLGELLVAQGAVAREVVDATLERQQQARQQKGGERGQDNRLIRVDADKLDQLITLVGELIIAGSGVHARARQAGLVEVVEAAMTLARLVEHVRDSALGLRMVQIAPTFQRFQRVVRDVSRDIGKDIELDIDGGDTELDKSLVERIGDPLMHLVRNAMDHGIETREAREAAGKPPRARVGLNAFHDSGSIVIEVSDDGGGLDTAKIKAKAIERGLLAPSATPSTQEIHRLIFEPGFSTADAVSNLSGRGVGMDVVRRNIETLRGSVDIDSVPGAGTTVRIRLPLTLAIIDGFLVGLGAARYVLPLDVVVECLELPAAACRELAERGFIAVRGEAVPVLRLREVFDLGDGERARENVVIVRAGSLKAGLVVDELLGELQTMIKPLGKLFSCLQGITGSTILGSGEVALILDVPGLVKRAEAQRVHGAAAISKGPSRDGRPAILEVK
ncbi:MAG TPA: chemotaxis protein CheA [Gammaproteobacteria bacterium]|mgnify:CR=1 FL=1|nr:chemotaxis protein CheA [Gammaproteobacteria bacterium]